MSDGRDNLSRYEPLGDPGDPIWWGGGSVPRAGSPLDVAPQPLVVSGSARSTLHPIIAGSTPPLTCDLICPPVVAGPYLALAYRIGEVDPRVSLAVSSLTIGDQEVSPTPTGSTSIPWLAYVKVHDGADDQEVDYRLWSATGGQWRHRLAGIAWVAVLAARSEMPSLGIPTVTCRVETSEITDWAGTSRSLSNPWAALFYYLTSRRWPPRLAEASIDAASWTAAADWCDVDPGDGTRLWSVNGVLAGRSPREVVAEVLEHCWGYVWRHDGRLHAAVDRDLPAAHASIDDWLEGELRTEPIPDEERVLHCVAHLSNAETGEDDWREHRAPGYPAGALQTLHQRLRLCTCPSMATRWAHQRVLKDVHETRTFSAVAHPGDALDLAPGDRVDVTADVGFEGQPFRLLRTRPLASGCVELEGRVCSPEALSMATGPGSLVTVGGGGPTFDPPAALPGVTLRWLRSRDRRTASSQDVKAWAIVHDPAITVLENVEASPDGTLSADRVQGSGRLHSTDLIPAWSYHTDPDGRRWSLLWARSATGEDVEVRLGDELTTGLNTTLVRVRPWWTLLRVRSSLVDNPCNGPRLQLDGHDLVLGGALAWPTPEDRDHAELIEVTWQLPADVEPGLLRVELRYRTIDGDDAGTVSGWITHGSVLPAARRIAWGTSSKAELPALPDDADVHSWGLFLVNRHGATELVPEAVEEAELLQAQTLEQLVDVDSATMAADRLACLAGDGRTLEYRLPLEAGTVPRVGPAVAGTVAEVQADGSLASGPVATGSLMTTDTQQDLSACKVWDNGTGALGRDTAGNVLTLVVPLNDSVRLGTDGYNLILRGALIWARADVRLDDGTTVFFVRDGGGARHVAELDTGDRVVLGAAEGTLVRGVLEGPGDPTAGELPDGHWAVWRDTTTGKTYLICNHSGAMRRTVLE